MQSPGLSSQGPHSGGALTCLSHFQGDWLQGTCLSHFPGDAAGDPSRHSSGIILSSSFAIIPGQDQLLTNRLSTPPTATSTRHARPLPRKPASTHGNSRVRNAQTLALARVHLACLYFPFAGHISRQREVCLNSGQSMQGLMVQNWPCPARRTPLL